MTLHQIVTKLTGPISSIGETNADEQRRQNLEMTIELVGKLIEDIDDAATSAGSNEHSRKMIGKRAKEFLDSLGEDLAH